VSHKIETGNKGETLAADFLVEKGFQILERNYRYKHAEIDLIVQKNDWVLFIEVKTRSSFEFGEPEEFVDDRKANRIFEAAEETGYLKRRKNGFSRLTGRVTSVLTLFPSGWKWIPLLSILKTPSTKSSFGPLTNCDRSLFHSHSILISRRVWFLRHKAPLDK
jgi:putative endonuclease